MQPYNGSWQGSAHTGPALTPAEVLVAIHGINPEKDRLSLKKACIYLLVVIFILEAFVFNLKGDVEQNTHICSFQIGDLWPINQKYSMHRCQASMVQIF